MVTFKMNKNYRMCSKTVMDTSDPYISFDANGVSNHYWDFENNVKPNWHNNPSSNDHIEKIIDRLKTEGKGKDFDCVIGLSGGLDSSYLLHKLVSDYGLRPLVFHVDGGWNSETAVNNINKLIDTLNLDLFTEVINWEEMKNFQLAMFKSAVPHLDVPQDMAFVSALYRFAQKHKIKNVLSGGNISTECVLMPLNILYWGTDMLHIKDILNKFGNFSMKSYPFTSVYYNKIYLPYIYGIKIHKPLNFITYIQSSAISELEKVYSWKPYQQKHFESRFTRFFEGFWLPSRFGYDMRRNQLSSLILTGQLSRNDALEILKKPALSNDEVDQEFGYIASKLNISVDQLWSYHKLPLKYYWDYKNSKIIFDLGAKLLNLLSISSRRGGSF